jgi:hypothetical protein
MSNDQAPPTTLTRPASLCASLAFVALAWVAPGVHVAAAAPLDAINRTTVWAERHRSDPHTTLLQNFVFDAWTRYLIATLHPDAATRARVGMGLDEDLRHAPTVAPTDPVPLTYWAVLLRLMAKRSVDYRVQQSDTRQRVVLDPLLRGMTPTTAYWTAGLLHHSDLIDSVAQYFANTWLVRSAATPSGDYAPSLGDARRVFHELVPRTDLGTLPPRLDIAQQQFLARTIPALLRFCRTSALPDALAEAMVAAALVDFRSDPEYSAALGYLLSQQRSDGTFLDPSQRGQEPSADNMRHTVLVGLWALLTTETAHPGAQTPAWSLGGIPERELR